MTRFAIRPDRSIVWIDATSSVHPIHSRTTGLTGYLDAEVGADGRLDLSVKPAGRLELQVERLRSGNALEDREMQRRIDARRFPTVSGELRSMEATGQPDRYRIEGDVIFHGVTRVQEGEMTVTVAADGSLRLEGSHVFDIREFGVEPPRILMLKVHPEVSVRVEIVAEAEG